MPSLVRPFVSTFLAISLAAPYAAPAFPAPAITKEAYEACQAQDEAAFRLAIATITIKALEQGIASVDYQATVDSEWRQLDLDDIIDKRVDIAVSEIRSESSWGSLLQSITDQAKAQELATAVADRVYRSEAVKTAIEGLAVGVGTEVGKRLEFASQDAAEPALRCLQEFLGPRYGATVAQSVSVDAGREFAVEPGSGSAKVSAGAVLKESAGGITGAAILIMRRQLANMASRIGQRLVGSVLSRLVSVVAGGIGLVLIAKDIWDLRNGVLPIIATEMKSKATKEKVQEELARSIAEEMGQHVKEIGEKSAERVVMVWQDFRRAHAKALELAEHNDAFRAFLNGIRPDSYARLDEVVSLILPAEGEAGVLRRLSDGTLNEAVNTLPPAAMEIARETRSIETAMQWNAVAGSALPKVIEFELHRRANPQDFTRAALDRLFAIEDRLAITRLAGIGREARDALFDLDPSEMKSLARSLTETELKTLARYLTGLDKSPREQVLRSIAESPARMQVLASDRVRDAIVSSEDQSAAVTMMLRVGSRFNPSAIAEDFALAWEGRISPYLLWEKHPLLIGLAAFAALLFLLILRRLVAPRRRAAAT